MIEGKFNVDPATGCWLWTRGKNRKGYGVAWDGSRQVLAHRLSYTQHCGRPIPRGINVCHRCDVRHCVNPDHLFLGTNADNNADKTAKGRQLKGRQIKTAKLSPDDVRAIRRSSDTIDAAALRFGVSRSLISLVRRRHIWKWVSEECSV